jgi:hypothetical protein
MAKTMMTTMLAVQITYEIKKSRVSLASLEGSAFSPTADEERLGPSSSSSHSKSDTWNDAAAAHSSQIQSSLGYNTAHKRGSTIELVSAFQGTSAFTHQMSTAAIESAALFATPPSLSRHPSGTGSASKHTKPLPVMPPSLSATQRMPSKSGKKE